MTQEPFPTFGWRMTCPFTYNLCFRHERSSPPCAVLPIPRGEQQAYSGGGLCGRE